MISLIVAVSKNGIIGSNGQLPWHLPADLKYFKEITTDNVVIMGRKTYDSIGKALPNRINVVLTRSDREFPGCDVAHDLFEVMKIIKSYQAQGKEIFIIGGAELFKMMEPYADRMHVTVIDHEFDGDTFMPALIDRKKWGHMSMRRGVKDSKNLFDYYFNVYYRKAYIVNE